MRITIQARNFTLTNALRSHIERRLRYALTQHDSHIRSVLVRLSDINGPRGGPDKCCHILIALEQLPNVVIKDTKVDLYDAINCAAGRAGRTVTRRLARARALERIGGVPDQQVLSANRI